MHAAIVLTTAPRKTKKVVKRRPSTACLLDRGHQPCSSSSGLSRRGLHPAEPDRSRWACLSRQIADAMDVVVILSGLLEVLRLSDWMD